MGTRHLPYSESAEDALIGAALLSSQALEILCTEVEPEDFHIHRNATIATVLRKLRAGAVKIDVVTVGDELDRTGDLQRIGGLYKLIELQNACPATSTASNYARIILDYAVRRRLLEASQEISGQILENGEVGVDLLMERARQAFGSVEMPVLHGAKDPSVDEFLEGPVEYDWLIEGLLERGDRLLITAAEGTGKSTALRQIAVTCAAGIHPFRFTPLTEGPLRVLIIDVENCFAGETEVVTYNGIRTLKELAGSTAQLLTCRDKGHGTWVDAEVRSFGMGHLRKITLERRGVEKTLYATGNHRWVVKKRRNRLASAPNEIVTTDELQPGYHLPRIHSSPTAKKADPSAVGAAHGLVFGDGHLKTARGAWERPSAAIHLIGEKNEQLLHVFGSSPARKTSIGTFVDSLPRSFKRYPDLAESDVYLLGWAAGYFAADGSVGKTTGLPTIISAERENLEFYRTVCNRLGIGTNPIHRDVATSSFTGEPHVMYRLHLDPDTLAPSFFLIAEHRRRFESRPERTKAYEWRVVSVEETDRYEEVFCAVVPETERFALADNILTMNSEVQVRRKLRPLVSQARDVVNDDFNPENLRIRIKTDGLDLMQRTDVRWLMERVEANRPDLLVIGPLYKLHAGDPVDEAPARHVSRTLDMIRHRYGCALLMEAHSPYATGQGGKRIGRPYGASLWSRWPEFGYCITPNEDNPDEFFLDPWRGPRDERSWPQVLTKGGVWPWMEQGRHTPVAVVSPPPIRDAPTDYGEYAEEEF